MKDSEIIKELVYLQALYIRWYERNVEKKFKTYESMNYLIFKGKDYVTLSEGVQNLLQDIEKYCECIEINKRIFNLSNFIKSSKIKNLKIGFFKDFNISQLEIELNRIYSLYQLEFNIDFTTIEIISKKFGLNQSEIESACEEEALLNTKYIQGIWLVHPKEVAAYFNL